MNTEAKDLIRHGRSSLLATLDQALAAAADSHKMQQAGQLSLFENSPQAEAPPLKDGPDLTWLAILEMEKQAIGFYLSGHPVDEYLEQAKGKFNCSIAQLSEEPEGKEIRLIALVSALTFHQTKKQTTYARLLVEDWDGSAEAIIWPEALEKYRAVLKLQAVVILTARIQRKADYNEEGEVKPKTTLIVNQVEKLS